MENSDDCSKQDRREEMNSENACQTSTGNYTTPGMSQQCRTLEAIQKSLAYCAFAVTQRYFHSSSPTSRASALTVFTLVLLFSLTHLQLTVALVSEYDGAYLHIACATS